MFESPVRKKGVSENSENGSREGYVMTLAKAAAHGVRGREAGRKLRSRHHEREHHLECDTNIDAKHIASCFPSLSFLLFSAWRDVLVIGPKEKTKSCFGAGATIVAPS
jgi:hypothetical protein